MLKEGGRFGSIAWDWKKGCTPLGNLVAVPALDDGTSDLFGWRWGRYVWGSPVHFYST